MQPSAEPCAHPPSLPGPVCLPPSGDVSAGPVLAWVWQRGSTAGAGWRRLRQDREDGPGLSPTAMRRGRTLPAPRSLELPWVPTPCPLLVPSFRAVFRLVLARPRGQQCPERSGCCPQPGAAGGKGVGQGSAAPLRSSGSLSWHRI